MIGRSSSTRKFLFFFIVTITVIPVILLSSESSPFKIIQSQFLSQTIGFEQNQYAVTGDNDEDENDDAEKDDDFDELIEEAEKEEDVEIDVEIKNENDETNNSEQDEKSDEDGIVDDTVDNEEDEEDEGNEEDDENESESSEEDENTPGNDVKNTEEDTNEEDTNEEDTNEEDTNEEDKDTAEEEDTKADDTEEEVEDEEGNEESTNNDSAADEIKNEPSKPHPFAGARDANGQWGYVADVTSVKRRHLELYGDKEYLMPKDRQEYNDVCEKGVGEGIEGPGGFELIQKIQIGAEESPKKPKLLCAIYTFEGNHNRIDAVADSWGWKCDGFLAASTLTNETIGAVDLPHLGEEKYDNMWQKTRSIWGYIYENYLDEYDFFWLGGDDYFMVVENMVNYLGTLDQNEALYLGQRIPRGNLVFCGGGPGYVLNKVALKRFAEEATDCYSEKIISAEDRFMSICMKDKLGLECQSTVDAKGQQRFTGMDADFTAKFNGQSGFFKGVYDFWAKESGEFKVGIDLISEHANGFHILRTPSMMLRYYALFHPEDACPKDSVFVQTLLSYLAQEDDDEEGSEEEDESVES